MRFSLILAVLTAALSGCAGIDAINLTDELDKTDKGFRYYDTSPFLLMYTDNKGGLKSELLYLPDTTKKRSIKPYSYGAKNDTTLKFDNGRLVGAKSVIDETIIPNSILTGLEKIATSQIKAANADKEEIPGPYLFRIIKSGNDWKLAGGQALKNGQAATIRYAVKGAQ